MPARLVQRCQQQKRRSPAELQERERDCKNSDYEEEMTEVIGSPQRKAGERIRSVPMQRHPLVDTNSER
jgi:hypothetical protein